MDRSGFDAAVATLAARQGGVVALRQLAVLGGTPAKIKCRVRSSRWERLAPGVFKLSGTPATWHQRLWAAYLEAGHRAVVSHTSAAQLLGFRGFTADAVEITKWRSRDHKVRLSRLHETSWLPPEHITVIDGLPCTTVARCVFDLAGDPPPWARGKKQPLEVHALRTARVFNNALAHHGLTMDKAAEVLAALGRRGRPGTALMRRLLREFGAAYIPTESELESMFLALVRSVGLPDPERQATVGGADGVIGRVDFLFREAKLVVEVDGGPWHDGPLDRDLDVSRDLRLRAQGWHVIRVRWQQLVNEPELVVAALRVALDRSRQVA